MCNCKSEIEKKLLKLFIENEPEAKSHCATLEGYTLVLDGNRLVQKGCMQITLVAAHKVKKSGEFKAKKQTRNMIFEFCPFCGKRYDEQRGVAS